MSARRSWLLVALVAFAFSGCSHSYGGKSPSADPAASVAYATCTLEPTQGHATRGTVTFTETKDGSVKVVADLVGLTPGQQHAMHVHEKGDCSAPDASSAGSHYNPEGHDHGMPPGEPRHAGDLGNVTADAKGAAHYELVITNVTVKGAKNPIDGRAVIVHAKPDDGGQPVGNAGGRIACGVIVAR